MEQQRRIVENLKSELNALYRDYDAILREAEPPYQLEAALWEKECEYNETNHKLEMIRISWQKVEAARAREAVAQANLEAARAWNNLAEARIKVIQAQIRSTLAHERAADAQIYSSLAHERAAQIKIRSAQARERAIEAENRLANAQIRIYEANARIQARTKGRQSK
jgi:hypothetical protein